jgi:hypothetical protein
MRSRCPRLTERDAFAQARRREVDVTRLHRDLGQPPQCPGGDAIAPDCVQGSLEQRASADRVTVRHPCLAQEQTGVTERPRVLELLGESNALLASGLRRERVAPCPYLSRKG